MNDFTPPPLTDEDVILNSKLEHLYNHEFGDGRFFQVVFSDEDETHIKLAARTCLKVVYLKEKDDIEGFEIIKLVSDKEKERVKLSKFNLEQLTCFLEFIKELDFKDVTKRRISLADDELSVLDSETKAKIATLLSGDDGSDVVYELLDKGLITNQDLVNTGYRKHQLKNCLKHCYIEVDYLNIKFKLALPTQKMKQHGSISFNLTNRYLATD